MSILQTAAPQQHAAAIIQSLLRNKPNEVEWSAYAPARDQIVERQNAMDCVSNTKRIEALKYLGSRGYAHGEKYDKAEPRVFTPEFVQQLSTANGVRRLHRNPWLEEMINNEGNEFVMSSTNANVLPFASTLGA